MKTHPLLKIASLLNLLCGAASILAIVWFTVFGVLLAEEEDPSINILMLTCFLIMALIAVMLELVCGNNALKGSSLSGCRSLGMSAVLFNALAWLTGFLSGQFWIPFPCGIVIGVLYLMGVRKTIQA